MKENDIILNMLANPDFTIADFQSVGLTGDNTGLRSEQEYLQSEKIRSNDAFKNKDTGEFDEAKFHNFYIGAGLWYNLLATSTHEAEMTKLALFGKGNMWVDPTRRTIDFTPKLVRSSNEHLVTNSLESIGKRGLRTLSQSEIAQTQKIYDTKTGEWKDSPNDSFFDNFFDTLVLATYDEDKYDEQGNLLHQKGERKLNEEGLPYYETLGGRDVYGKQVLNKFNMITTDGSFANKFDFFDTDDLEQKSIGGTIMRNAALVGSMFIPYVKPWITGLSVATQTTGLLATLGKLLVGNENETLNNILAWAKTVNRQGLTEYAAQNTWCVENFLNMIGDTIGLLREQRWIFKSIPKALGHGKAVKAMSGDKKYDEVVDEVEKELAKKGALNTTRKLLDDVVKSGGKPTELIELEGIAKSFGELNRQKAINYVDDLIKQANNVGSPISKAYMTALVVQDTYGEAKLAGASDLEAALLTLGYAAGEAAILNSPLGEWILPELKGTKLKHRAIVNALTKEVKEAYGQLAKDGSKKGFVQKLLKIGKDISDAIHAEKLLSGSKSLGTIGANALTESAEEVTEELWSDVSKSIFNAYRWLSGQEALGLGEWENMVDRYGMSALGGFFGGGISSAATDFQQVKNLANMDKKQAMHELLYIVNNNKEGEFLDSLEEMSLGNKNLSAQKIIDQSNGNIVYAEGTKDDNQDREIKNIVKSNIKLIRDILESEGAKISTKSLLNRLTLEDLQDVRKHMRYGALLNTRSMNMYLEDFAKIQADIVKTKAELMSLDSGKIDSDKSTNINVDDKRKELEEELKKLRVKKDAYLKGQIAPEAIRDAIFEMNPILNAFLTKTNLKMYAEAKLGKKWNILSDEEKKDITKKYKEYSETSMKNDIHIGATILLNMMELFSPFAKLALDFALDQQKTYGQTYQRLQLYLTNLFTNRILDDTDLDQYINDIQTILQTMEIEFGSIMGKSFLSQDIIDLLKSIESNTTLDPKVAANWYMNVLYDGIADSLDSHILDFIKLGYIHPEIKQALKSTLTIARESLSSYSMNINPEDITSYVYQIENDPSLDFVLKMLRLLDKLEELNNKVNNIDTLITKIDKLSNTPIVEYLNQFGLNTTNTDLNITKHLQRVTYLLEDAKNNNSLDEMTLSEEFCEDNEEALLLLDSFIAVINGMKNDNADIINPTGYSKMLNEVYSKQGIKNYTHLTELDSTTADIILLDALLIKEKLLFALDIHKINTGLKLKQHTKVNNNKNFLLYNTLKTRFVNVIPDKWIGKEDGSLSAKDLLQSVLDSSDELKKLTLDNLKLSKEQRNKINKEITKISNTIYDIFNLNKKGDSWDSAELKQILLSFAGMSGFFQKTGDVLNDQTKFLDDNSFIWWIASKAVLKQSDFDAVYLKSLTKDLAPISSLELAVQLGVAAITNMNGLNAFVDAYCSTVVEEFNNKTPDERKKLLEQFDDKSDGFADKLLKYFASYDALPQYQNIVFIEGIPGSGKSGGVFKSIVAVMNQIDPNWLDNSVYAHVKKKSAENAGKKIGLKNGQYHDKESLMKWISSEWKDVLHNPSNKNGSTYLYKDSYEFDSTGKLVNKWKVNKITNAPKVMFIDEVSHYNLQELSMIEQFAKLNEIVVLTAGDLDQDTLTTYFTEGGEELSVTINRNNFIRTPKLGLSLRSLNKLMTHDITVMLTALTKIKEGLNVVGFNFTYLEDDPNHAGLFGVKTTSLLTDDTKKTIQTMIDTSTDKIGYIYHDENTELYKYLSNNFKDKINFYKDSEAQGLEGQYYIVENDLSFEGTAVDNTRSLLYARSLYTGISRAELGVLAFVPLGQYGLFDTISSSKDPTYLLESIGEKAIENASKERKEELEELGKEFISNPIKIIPPSSIASTSTTILKPSNTLKPAGLPDPLLSPITIPNRIGTGYTSKYEAQSAITYLNNQINGLSTTGTTEVVAINKDNNNEYEIIGTKIVESDDSSGVKVYTPIVTLHYNGNDEEFSIDEFNKDFTLKNKTTNTVAMIYDVGDKLIIEENGAKSEIIITNRTYVNDSEQPKYVISNLDGSNSRELYQNELQNAFVEYYIENTPETTPSTNIVPDSGLENDTEELASGITSENTTLETVSTFANRLGIRIYTFNGFEVGFGFENGRIKYKGTEKTLNERIDNGIGLAKLLGMDLNSITLEDYNRIKQFLGDIKRTVYHKENKNIIELFELNFGFNPDNCHIQYAIKSSDPNENKNFERYYSDGLLDYIYSDAEEADILKSKKIVMLVKNGDEVVFELTVGSLSSPLTIMQQLDEKGNLKFKKFLDKYKEAKNIGKSNDYEIINYMINELEGTITEKNEEFDLLNLFKFYLFNSNGIFYFGYYKDYETFVPNYSFTLSKCISSGSLLTRERGLHQLDGKFLYTGLFIKLKDFVNNPLFRVSSVLSAKNHGGKIKAGYPFVLISTNPDITSDEELVRAYENGNSDVKMYYIMPPRASVSEWFLNQHKNYQTIKSTDGTIQVKSLVGNEFTGYRILKALKESGEFDSFTSFVSFKDGINQAFETLLSIERKWKETDILFSGNIIDGSNTDQQLYEKYLEIYKDLPDKELRARERLITIELLNYLHSKNNFGSGAIGITPDTTIAEAINKYLRNLIQNEWIGSDINKDVLKRINDICEENGLNGILYKTFLSSESVGPNSEYVKVVTASGDNKYSIQGVEELVDFEINAKIDPPSFMSEILYLLIERFTSSNTNWNNKSEKGNIHRTSHFYYNPSDRTWKLTDLSLKFLNDYLNKPEKQNQEPLKSTIKSEIKHDYAKYFNDGLLDESLLDESKTRVENLVILAQSYNQNPGKFGFVYKNLLVLTTFDESIILDNPNSNVKFDENNVLYGHDSNKVDYKFTIYLDEDLNGVVKLVNVDVTKYTYPNPNANPSIFEDITERDLLTFKQAVEEYNKKQQSDASKISIKLLEINSLEDLEKYALDLKDTLDPVELLALYEDSNLFNELNLNENLNLPLKVLNYVNQDVNTEINKYNIVRYNNQRLLIVSPTQYQVLGENEFVDQPLNDREFFDLTDEIRSNMKMEEIICNQVIWKLVTKF